MRLCRLAPRLVSSCGPFCYAASRLPSRWAWRCAGRPPAVLLYRPRSCVVLILYRAVVPPRSSRLAMRGGGTTCVSIPCRRASCAVSLSHSLRLVPVRLRSSSFVVVGMSVSLRGACGEIELTKTAHFNDLVISVSSCSCSCSCCVAMGIGPGRTVMRQGTGAGLFGRSFCRICPQVVSAN